MSTPVRARVARAAALLATAAALGATSVVDGPCDRVGSDGQPRACCEPVSDAGVFAVESTCGPAGLVEATYGPDCEGDLMALPGGPAVGLPDGGLLEVPQGDWDPEVEVSVIREGRFVLLGPVVIPGTTTRVHRTCRLTPAAGPGAFSFSCTGPEPQAPCAGTLTLVEPPP